jgi:hypothetical protein
VDNDPVVLVHARALLTSDPAGVTSYIDADARDPDTMVAAAGATLDFGEPVAIIMVDLLNFIDDEAAASVVPRLTAAVAPGSYLAIMHPASDLDPALPEAGRRWNELAAQPVWLRSREDVNRFLAGLGELWQRSGGNPFFVRELTRLLAAQGSWQQPAQIPASVAETLRRRLARLSTDCVRLLERAAVAGRDIDVNLLADSAAAGQEPAVLSLLDSAGSIPNSPGTCAYPCGREPGVPIRPPNPPAGRSAEPARHPGLGPPRQRRRLGSASRSRPRRQASRTSPRTAIMMMPENTRAVFR